MDSVNVRNLEQIQEDDSHRGVSRLTTLLLAGVGGAALVIAAVTMAQRSGPPATSNEDPLAALVADAEKKAPPDVSPEQLDGQDVSFPAVLSDEAHPTTALAAVKGADGRLIEHPADPGNIEALPPPATDRLPVVPLPVGSLLNATPVTTAPKDQLTAMASQVSEVDDAAEMAPAGDDSGYQIQVASFKDQGDADKLVADLRKRGHQAFRQAAYVPARGLWHRVRIGPFDTKFQAIQYKKKFEEKERMSPFVVDPHEVKRAAEIRAAKLEARKRKYGKP